MSGQFWSPNLAPSRVRQGDAEERVALGEFRDLLLGANVALPLLVLPKARGVTDQEL